MYLSRPKSARQITKETLLPFIEESFFTHKMRFGSRRIALDLEKKGIPCNQKRVQRIMSEAGLVPLQGRHPKRKRGKVSDDGTNILNRDFEVATKNQVWCGDITYIPTKEGWLYLASYLDLYSRKIVGWQVSPRINENLVIDALDCAVNRENPPEGLMIHTDRGSQYTSRKFSKDLENRNFVQSFSKKGCPYDNAVMESFYKTLKQELPLDKKYETRLEARQEIFKFIEMYYNTTRPHSSIGNLSPIEYERKNCQSLAS